MFGQFPFSNFAPGVGESGANGKGSTPPRPPGKKNGVKTVTIQHIEMPYVDHLYDEMDGEESYKRKNTGGVSSVLIWKGDRTLLGLEFNFSPPRVLCLLEKLVQAV
jgi:hypothetical protein